MVLAGDYNVIPTDIDVYKPERWVDDALFRPETRAAYHQLLAQGWTDSIRRLHPTDTIYTYWDFFRNAYGRDAGLRIDHLLLNPRWRRDCARQGSIATSAAGTGPAIMRRCGSNWPRTDPKRSASGQSGTFFYRRTS